MDVSFNNGSCFCVILPKLSRRGSGTGRGEITGSSVAVSSSPARCSFTQLLEQYFCKWDTGRRFPWEKKNGWLRSGHGAKGVYTCARTLPSFPTSVLTGRNPSGEKLLCLVLEKQVTLH